MFPPAVTGLGVPLFVTARSQATVSGVEAVMFVLLEEMGSLLVVVTLADSAIGLEAAVTLARNGYITGQTINVNGGRYLA